MTRRGLVHVLSGIATGTGLSSILAEWLEAADQRHGSHQTAPAEPDYFRNYRPQFFSNEDFGALEAFTEILIPTDGTPGAREAHCAPFIDFVLHASHDYAPEVQQEWRDAMGELRQLGFHVADRQSKEALVKAISLPERDRLRRHAAFSAYLLIKHETVFAFYTSRAGMIEALDYRGNTYNVSFPACEHPEHHVV